MALLLGLFLFNSLLSQRLVFVSIYVLRILRCFVYAVFKVHIDVSSFKNQGRCASLLAKAVMYFCNYWHVMPWLTERSSGSSRLTSETWCFPLTDVLSAIQIQKLSFYTWITGKTSLSKQRFPADVGYTFRCRSIFIGSFPWTFLRDPAATCFPMPSPA